MSRTDAFLRMALLGDAVASGLTGLAAFAGAGLLADLLGLPTSLLRPAGFLLLPYAAFVAWLGTRARIPRGAVKLVVAVNLLWAVDSLVLLTSGWVAPTALGIAFVLFQAIVVAGFAAAQAWGLRAAGAARPVPA
jgi:hypothetical protein